MISPGLLFICGFPSGGTDLAKNILNAHPDIHICGEMPFLYYLHKYSYSAETVFKNQEEVIAFRDLLLKLDKWKNLENINSNSFTLPVSIQNLLRLWFTQKNAATWGNKTPQNSENIEGLLKIFPNAKFLIVIRDVRDISLSWKKKWGKDIFLCAYKWNTRMKKMLADLQQINESNYKIIYYEKMVSDLEKNSKDICNFLQVPWDSSMLNYHLHIEKITDGKINYGNKVQSENFNKWKKAFTEKEIKKIEEISFDTLRHFSYDIKFAKKSKHFSYLDQAAGHFKNIFSVLFVGNRQSSRNSFSYRLRTIFNQSRQIFLKLK